MSETFRTKDGDLYVDPVTGRLELVSGIEKCSQDIANALMTSLRQTNRSGAVFKRSYGSELTDVGGPTPVLFSGTLGKPLVQRKIQEAVQRLQVMQTRDASSTADERIQTIARILVESLNVTDFIYFLECVVESGDTALANNLQPTSLNHQFPMTGGVVKIPPGF